MNKSCIQRASKSAGNAPGRSSKIKLKRTSANLFSSNQDVLNFSRTKAPQESVITKVSRARRVGKNQNRSAIPILAPELSPDEISALFENGWRKALIWARHPRISDHEEVAVQGMLATFQNFNQKLGHFESRLWWKVKHVQFNLLRSEFRRQRRESRYAGYEADTSTEHGVGLDETEREQAVRRALEKLTPQQRRLVEQIYFEGKSCVEVAQTEGEVESTLRNRAATARKKLAGLLKDLAPDRTQSAPSKPGKSRHKRAQPKRGTTTEPGIGLPQASLAHPSAKSK